MFSDASALVARTGQDADSDPRTFILTIGGSVRIHIETATCRRADRGIPYWQVCPFPGADFTLIARFDFRNQALLDYLIIPAAVLSAGPIYLRLKTPIPESCIRLNSLDAAFGLVPLATAHP